MNRYDEKTMELIDYVCSENTNWISDMTISKDRFDKLCRYYGVSNDEYMIMILNDYGIGVE